MIVNMKLFDLMPLRGLDEAAARQAIAGTNRDIPLTIKRRGDPAPRVLGRISNLTVKDGAVYGDVEFGEMSGEVLKGDAPRVSSVSLEARNQ